MKEHPGGLLDQGGEVAGHEERERSGPMAVEGARLEQPGSRMAWGLTGIRSEREAGRLEGAGGSVRAGGHVMVYHVRIFIVEERGEGASPTSRRCCSSAAVRSSCPPGVFSEGAFAKLSLSDPRLPQRAGRAGGGSPQTISFHTIIAPVVPDGAILSCDRQLSTKASRLDQHRRFSIADIRRVSGNCDQGWDATFIATAATRHPPLCPVLLQFPCCRNRGQRPGRVESRQSACGSSRAKAD